MDSENRFSVKLFLGTFNSVKLIFGGMGIRKNRISVKSVRENDLESCGVHRQPNRRFFVHLFGHRAKVVNFSNFSPRWVWTELTFRNGCDSRRNLKNAIRICSRKIVQVLSSFHLQASILRICSGFCFVSCTHRAYHDVIRYWKKLTWMGDIGYEKFHLLSNIFSIGEA